MNRNYSDRWVSRNERVSHRPHRAYRRFTAQDAVELFKDIGDDLDNLMKGWDDIQVSDIDEKEIKTLEEFSKVMEEVQKAVKSSIRRAKLSRRASRYPRRIRRSRY